MARDESDDAELAAGRSARPRRDTEPGTPRAIAHGSDPAITPILVDQTAISVEPRPRGLEGAAEVTFGGRKVRVEHHGGEVAIVLADGTLLLGSDDEACELGALLLGAATRRY